MKNKVKSIGLMSVIFLLIIGITSAAFPDEVGTHANEAIIDPNINIRESSFIESILSGGFQFQAIATTDVSGRYVGNFERGETVNFRIDVTSFNTPCERTFVVVEVYNPSNIFVKSSSKFIGTLIGGNNYFVADIPYSISSNAPIGTWNAAGYLWCDSTNTVISQAYHTSFLIQDTAPGEICDTGFVGDNTCRSDFSTSSGNGQDVYQLFRNSDCSTQYQRKIICSSTQICNVDRCEGIPDPARCGDGKCETLKGETAQSCPSDCEVDDGNGNGNGVIPPITPPDEGFTGIQIGIIIAGILVILGGVWFFFFKR